MRGKDRHNYGEEEEDEVRWMRRMRRIRMRKDRTQGQEWSIAGVNPEDF